MQSWDPCGEGASCCHTQALLLTPSPSGLTAEQTPPLPPPLPDLHLVPISVAPASGTAALINTAACTPVRASSRAYKEVHYAPLQQAQPVVLYVRQGVSLGRQGDLSTAVLLPASLVSIQSRGSPGGWRADCLGSHLPEPRLGFMAWQCPALWSGRHSFLQIGGHL